MSFKKTKVVMLSTNEKAGPISIGNKSGIAEYHIFQHEKSGIYNNHTFQHLYFLSDEEIKKGDWCLDVIAKQVFQVDSKILNSIKSFEKERFKKIIATTDSNLTIKTLLFVQGENKEIDVLLPQLSQSFIEKFVEEYNKGNVIAEVMVEYDFIKGIGAEFGYKSSDIEVLKISKDNTITIRKVKDSWNRDEVMKFGNWCRIHDSKFPNQVWTIQQLFDKWIEENL